MTKKIALDDLKRVAAKLQRTPTRDEYQEQGRTSKHMIRKLFGSYEVFVKEAGLKGQVPLSITERHGYELAQLRADHDRLKNYTKELEQEIMTTNKMRELIGAPRMDEIGEAADWLKGPREVKSGLTGIPTLFLSDIHYDEVVKPEQINGVNEYNHEIANARLKHTFQTALDLTTKHLSAPKYEGFICALGGDMLSGNIHEELAETNDQTITRSIIDLTDVLIGGISGIADQFGKVFVPCVVGNHGRLHKKPRYKYKVEHNYEWLVYQYLARHFKNDARISFLIPEAPDVQWTVYGRTYNLNHGDQFKGGSGISGIYTPLMLGMARKQKKQTGIGQPFDVMMNGHWHQYIHTDNLIINGSVKGYDEFANGHNFAYEPPQQALFIVHPTKRETFRMPILCDEKSKLNKVRNVLAW